MSKELMISFIFSQYFLIVEMLYIVDTCDLAGSEVFFNLSTDYYFIYIY